MGRRIGLVCALLLAPSGTSRLRGQEAPAPTATLTLRGRVDFRREPHPLARRPSISELGLPTPRDVPNLKEAIVYLEVGPRGAFEEREESRATIDQKNENFVPHILAITAGTTVDFRNDDRTFHNVFSLSKAKPFDLGRYPTGQTKSVRFDHPGVVRVFCEIHSHMSAFIVVFAHRYFALTNDEGDYKIEGIPPGTFTVAVWHPLLTTEPKVIRVPEGGGELDLDFALS